MAASLFLEITKGGPFDGLPALSLRFENEGDELDSGPLEILRSLEDVPSLLSILVVDGALNSNEALAMLLGEALHLGMSTIVETYEDVLPWMMDKMIARRVLHTRRSVVRDRVEEIVFHGEVPPAWKRIPFHRANPPVTWWAPPVVKGDIFPMLPASFRLWLPRARVEKRLYPEEDGR